MKIFKSNLCLFLFCAFATKVNAQQPFTVNGRSGKLPKSAKAYLDYDSKLDSTAIINGKFQFKGVIENPIYATLIVNKDGNGPKAKGVTSIACYLDAPVINVTSADSLNNATIKGGEINVDNARLTSLLKPSKARYAEILAMYNKATPEERKEEKFSKMIDSSMKAMFAMQRETTVAYIKNHPDALFDIFLLRRITGGNPDIAQIESLYNGLSERVRNSKSGAVYMGELNLLKRTMIGAMAPDFTMEDTAGRSISLNDFKGKYVLLDFWASWCGPCRAENPNIRKNYAAYHDKGFEILGVSLDNPSGKSAWLKAIANDQITWPQVSDLKGWKNAAARLYSIHAIPQNFLIGPDGKIIAKDLRGERLGEVLQGIFN